MKIEDSFSSMELPKGGLFGPLLVSSHSKEWSPCPRLDKSKLKN